MTRIDTNANITITTGTPTSNPSLADFLPSAKIGSGNYIYVWNTANRNGGCAVCTLGNDNYFGIAIPFVTGTNGAFNTRLGLSVQDAYNMDNKIDDGLPNTGRVIALWITSGSIVEWVAGDSGAGDGHATPPSATSCYDDGGTTGAPRHYSLNQNKGTGINCALSFEF